MFMSPPIPKMITDAVYLIIVLERTVRFASLVDVVLEGCTNCLPNNK